MFAGALAAFLRLPWWAYVGGAALAYVLFLRYDAASARREVEAQRTAAAAEQFRRNEVLVAASARYENRRATSARQVVEITREVDRVVEIPRYRDVCFDADGLRIVAAAIDGTPLDSLKPAVALPAAAASR